MVMNIVTEVNPSTGDLLYKSSNLKIGSGHMRKQISLDGEDLDLMGRLQKKSEAGQTTVYTGPALEVNVNVDNYIANVI